METSKLRLVLKFPRPYIIPARPQRTVQKLPKVQQNLQIYYALFVSLTLPLPTRIPQLRWQPIRRPVKQADRDSG